MARFSDASDPKLTAMIGGKSSEEIITAIKKTIPQGAEAFCILMQGMNPEEKNKETYRRIIDAMEGRPAYMANYIRTNSQPELTDEVLAEQLLEMADCGAALIDVRADMFCRSTDEFTRDKDAVRKQKELISQIHAMGTEALMSTHIFEYRSPENVLEMAKEQQARGVDIAKIVTVVNSDREVEDAFKTNFLLKEKLNVPFLFLCNGTHCRKHRLFGPLIGSCMYLCLENSRIGEPQPTIEEAKMLKNLVLNGGKVNE